MLWQEKTDSTAFIVPDDIVDLSFKIRCGELPIDHAWALFQAVQAKLPWIEQEPNFAIHSIHSAASGNGWVKPEKQVENTFQLSRRTRLYLRTPKARIKDVMTLTGSTLKLSSFEVNIGEVKVKPLVPTNNVFCRSVCGIDDENEEAFTHKIAQILEGQSINVTKILCGLTHTINSPEKIHNARSVLIADLTLEESIKLQQFGIGTERKLGCGIFLPHKSLAAVGESQSD